ncbi:MAG: recombination protein RecR [Deltaproteobacteria bacterium]|nr:MAG: recombination protein RecR [Deltaproteobacteria bacterium]
MTPYPPSIQTLIQRLSRLPGIGVKTAERMALHILRMPAPEAEALAAGIRDVKAQTRMCRQCFNLCDSDLCRLCADPSRNQRLVCVVENPADLIAIERSGAFTGVYHILQGVLSPMDGIGPADIRIRELLNRVNTGDVDEVVLATGTGVEGESTAAYIAEQLARTTVSVSRIASGVPMGGDLKLIDQVTLKRAMEARNRV